MTWMVNLDNWIVILAYVLNFYLNKFYNLYFIMCLFENMFNSEKKNGLKLSLHFLLTSSSSQALKFIGWFLPVYSFHKN